VTATKKVRIRLCNNKLDDNRRLKLPMLFRKRDVIQTAID